MQLNEQLNIVIPVRDEIKAFHTPISRPVFESCYRPLAAVKADMAAGGIYYQMDTGPSIAAKLFRDAVRKASENAGQFEADGKPKEAIAQSLFAEIRRLTTVLVPTPNGWESLPVDAAIQGQHIDEEEWEEVLSQIVFFTCHYALARKADRRSIAEATASLLAASLTSLPLSGYATSLPRSTTPETSKAEASSVPS